MEPVIAIVECPKGTGHKYNYDHEHNSFKLTKILPAGLVFPFDFGFVPGTKGQDGDPLDVIIISEIHTFPGCSMDCRIIGAIKANQTETDGNTVRNDRFLGIPEVSQQFNHVKTIEDLPEAIMTQVEKFFENYNEQAGKVFETLGHMTAEEAYALIK